MLLPHVLLLFRHRYNPAIHQAVARHAGRARWHVSVLTHAEDKPLSGLAALQGVLIADHFGDATIASILRSGVPVVNLSSNPERFEGARVTGDHEAIGRMAADYLLDRRHRHFAYCGDPTSVASRSRHAAFADTLSRHGRSCAEIDSAPRSDAASLDWAGESRRLQAGLAPLPAPSAVFCFNDIHAGRVLAAALQLGRLVPEELAILGVDDDPLVCENASVPLSSVRHALDEVGSRGAALLEAIMERRTPATTRLLLAPLGVTTRRSTESFAVPHPALQAILLHLDRQHHRPLGLQELADTVGVSPRTVQQLLHTHLGSTLTDELLKRRLAHARRLLAHPGPSVADIAATVGFSSPAYFHHAFKRHQGQTPRQYRESRLQAA